MPRHPVTTVRYGLRALQLGTPLGRGTFRTAEAAALFAGVAAHANARLPSVGAAASALFLLAHAHVGDGWAFPRGGAQAIADALAADLREHGGVIENGIAGDEPRRPGLGRSRSPATCSCSTRRRACCSRTPTFLPRMRAASVAIGTEPPLRRWISPSTGPFRGRTRMWRAAPTVHLGGTREEIEASENAVAQGRMSERPYVLTVQPSILDDTRAPAGKHVLWAYVHVPAGSTLDPTELVTQQVERFAPGFRERILASTAMTAAERQAFNPSDIGGDILGGAFSFVQAVRRPVVSRTPWRTPMRGVYLASASTPPGPGVTGMPGWYAARQALSDNAGVGVELDDLFG